MVTMTKKIFSIQQSIRLENAIAQATKNNAKIEYLAMMADIDIDEEEMEAK